MLRLGRHHGLGVTIGAAAVEAAELGGRMRGWSHPIEPLAEGTTRWPTLTTALEELRAARAGRGAALAIWPGLRQGSHDVAVLRSGRTELLHLDEGVLTGVRRVGGAAADGVAHDDASARDAVVPPTAGGALAILGPAPMRESLMRAM